MPNYKLTINQQKVTVSVEPEMPLLWVLRDYLGLTGTKFGCGLGVCGACTILQGNQSVRACQISCQDAAGKSFTTIEGLSKDNSHPCQKAWLEEDVAQCGFCQSGMILETAAFLNHTPNPTDEQIDEVLSQHVCRCGTYQRIRRAVHRAATK
ncbi:MAG TPA: (2Fe-2S)-binding protein [Acidobacteriota bacterium]|nr:(2Fe-2S)-binding protein [Acidobacteriota bacterium]HMZ78466.1 (2Fe-2S)-binding protein [Acidobacteriota bacterium]HNB70569.1 (2Fe-2S)-binding protein [Acidobacteriota bacterium]HNC45721.1 (2Fe-2S)-binding protein [Acidobacteriota bacterium]HNG93094.1 (2Fe-2S)-binding protein [Acidobacteriota bacterium]